ncbi:MAG TPA: SMI1/KNR4 family protein [Chitinophaga sp.]|uniref:SMI1/KNR4 family protein n=1 Tax=Chitinophaga sp. TaxID=1869181 RepID=UPI002BC2B50C|nr:SMI1/KNR4 family protein [Chitinophaga sp.]HVI47918.1 SMI1/KNR4 family protein [Chitinophaga sp.]
MKTKSIEIFIQEWYGEMDGGKFARKKDKLIKDFGATHRKAVIQALMQYAREGKLKHWRGFLMIDIVRLVGEGETAYATFFTWALTIPELAYWAVDGYLKTEGAVAYPSLTALAQNNNNQLDVRAKAVKSLAVHSGQPFDRGLPTDPGHWKPEHLRLPTLKQWQQDGYPAGKGYDMPPIHPALQQPSTPFEILAARLDHKLAAMRQAHFDKANPDNLLVIAADSDMQQIAARWTLPENYLLFLKNFSPLRAFIAGGDFAEGLSLYGAHDLIARQAGYSYNPVSNAVISDWPPHLVVIADDGADPYCLDLSAMSDGDAPVLYSRHGEGHWEFHRYAGNFLDFLHKLTA